MRYAGLIYDDSPHFIDHLAPFCALMKWPLIACEETIAHQARSYYPDLEVILADPLRLKLPSYTVTCDNQPLLQAAFPGQKTKTLWLPHGNSDKGWNSPFFEALHSEELALVYGQKMIDFMHAKKIYPKTVKIGNFRWQYYLKHQPFYQNLVRKFLPRQGGFLYAPTWDDLENNNSFWKAFPLLAQSLPVSRHLLIKLHPNTLRKYAVEIEILKGRYAKKKNIHFLSEFPPIYPLLSQCDAYIGDKSSIGYDFLRFDKPLYFLDANPSLYLSRCGTPIDPAQFDFSCADHLSLIRKEVYEYTFNPEPDWEQKIDALCSL